MSDQAGQYDLSQQGGMGPGVYTPTIAGENQADAFWNKVGQKLGTGTWNAVNQFGMGLPDWIMKNVVPSEQYQKIKALREANPTAATIGDIAGLGGSMLTGTGEAKLLSKAPGIIGKIGKAALGAPTTFGGNVVKGLAQALPQSAIRTATGNITPEQGALGLALGGGLGGVLGTLGSKAARIAQKAASGGEEVGGLGAKLVNGLRNMNDQTLIGALGGNGSMVRSTASFGLKGNQLMTKAAREENIIKNAARIINTDKILNKAALANTLDKRYNQVWNALDNAWEGNGMKLSNFKNEAMKLPNVQKYLGTEAGNAKVDPAEIRKALRAALGNQASDFVESGSGPLTAMEKATAEGLNIPTSAAVGSPKAQQIENMLNLADGEQTLPDIQNFLDSDYINIHPSGAGTRDLKKLRAAAIDIKKLAQDKAKEAALASGTLDPQLAQTFVEDYPAMVLLKKIYEGKTKQVFGANPGSDTAMKSLLAVPGLVAGGTLGYEGSNDQNKLGGAVMGALGGAALGGMGGSVLNQALTKGSNATLLRSSMALRKLLGQGAEAAAAPGAISELAAKGSQIPHAIPAIEAMMNGGSEGGIPAIPVSGTQEQPGAQQPEQSNVPTVDPNSVTWRSLEESNNPYFRAIGTNLRNIWSQQYALQKNADGTPISLDQVVKQYANATNGFGNVQQVANNILFHNNPAEAPGFIKNYNIADTLNHVNFGKVVDALKPITEKGKYIGLGLSPTGNPLGNAIMRMNPAERGVLTQINQLAHIAKVDPAVAIADLQRIASDSSLSDKQKADEIKRYYVNLYSAINGTNFNPGQLQSLGLFNGGGQQ